MTKEITINIKLDGDSKGPESKGPDSPPVDEREELRQLIMGDDILTKFEKNELLQMLSSGGTLEEVKARFAQTKKMLENPNVVNKERSSILTQPPVNLLRS